MAESAPPERPALALPLGLRVASIISWIWGIATAFVGLVVFTLSFRGIPEYRDPVLLITILLLAIVYGYAGYGLWRRSRVAATVAIGISALMSLATLLGVVQGRRVAFIGVLVNVTILGLVLMSWRHVRGAPSREVGA